ncbi:hypothetical protein AX16_000666 [Volvariella volvacea WC 439]|nr:hypothetical protein AX16_000666 [Volvariella volvacea WC 439]
MTIKNKYPLPLIQELIDKVKHSKVFTKFDVCWGYNNIRIKEGDEWKAAFKTNQGLFEPTVMFFGLTNSPATFQMFMNHIFRDLVNEGHVIVYIDDILIFTEDDFSKHAKPLTHLTGNVEFIWTDEQQKAFESIRDKICEEPILHIPQSEGKFRIEADSSEFANGGILSQFVNGQWRPITFCSKSLSPTERNYEIYDKELLTIMQALEDWRQYLVGTPEPFEIWTDHQNLTYFREPKKLNRRQARWVTELADYSFSLHHKPGSFMEKADALSRRSNYDRGEGDNVEVVLLKPEMFIWAIEVEGLNLVWIKKIVENNDYNTSVLRAVQNKEKGWESTGRLHSWLGYVVVPRDQTLCAEIIQAHHDPPTLGHPGLYRTIEQIQRNWWWPGIRRDVQKYIDGCEECYRDVADRKPY